MKKTINLTKKGLEQIVKEELKPTLSKPSKMGVNLKDNFKKELSKSSMKQGLKKKPNIKLSETDDNKKIIRITESQLKKIIENIRFLYKNK